MTSSVCYRCAPYKRNVIQNTSRAKWKYVLSDASLKFQSRNHRQILGNRVMFDYKHERNGTHTHIHTHELLLFICTEMVNFGILYSSLLIKYSMEIFRLVVPMDSGLLLIVSAQNLIFNDRFSYQQQLRNFQIIRIMRTHENETIEPNMLKQLR